MWTPWKSCRKSQKHLKPDTPDWILLWSIARFDLHLTDEEFWNLTWDEFTALLSRYKLSIERQDFHAALICAVLANIHRDPKTKPFTPKDFMPGKEEKKQTPAEMLAIFKTMARK